MENKNFLEYMQIILEAQKIDIAKQFLKDMERHIKKDSTIATLEVIFSIYEEEKRLGETDFFANRTSIPKLIECYEQLKFYLRRMDFDIYSEDTEFIDFIVKNKISGTAIITVVDTSIIHKIDVLNKVAMLLSEYDYLLLAVRILNSVYGRSKDNTTLLNFSLVLWKCGAFEDAQMVLEQITEVNDDVLFLSKLIKEKVKYNG